jgi:imidazolonepropionase-like amidohydrolase
MGSNAGTPGVIFGASFTNEIAYHTELGLSPAAAISLATQGNAQLLALDQVTGTIDVGKSADLVIVRNDPMISISALKSIAYIVRAGRLYDRDTFLETP